MIYIVEDTQATSIKDIMQQAADTIKNTLGRYIYNYTWLSGSSTTVYPVSIWNTSVPQIVVQLNTYGDKRRLSGVNRIMSRLAAENSHIKNYSIWSSDGSCPDTLTIYF